MNVEYSNIFVKDSSILPKQILRSMSLVIQNVKEAEDIRNIHNCRKIIGKEILYRVRIGDYRIVVFHEDKTIYFKRVLPCGEVYKKHNL